MGRLLQTEGNTVADKKRKRDTPKAVGGAEYMKAAGLVLLRVNVTAEQRDRVRAAAALAGYPSVSAYLAELVVLDSSRILKEKGVTEKG
jgi:hypothetical protein